MAGAGKSTVGRTLAKKLGFGFMDLDRYIAGREGRTVQQVIDEEGEEALLKLEKRRMREIGLARNVVSPGGSIIYHPDLMAYLKRNSTLVYLDDSFENIEGRLTDLPTRGVVGLKRKTLRQVYDERLPLYWRHADVTINCRGKTLRKIVAETTRRLKTLEKP